RRVRCFGGELPHPGRVRAIMLGIQHRQSLPLAVLLQNMLKVGEVLADAGSLIAGYIDNDAATHPGDAPAAGFHLFQLRLQSGLLLFYPADEFLREWHGRSPSISCPLVTAASGGRHLSRVPFGRQDCYKRTVETTRIVRRLRAMRQASARPPITAPASAPRGADRHGATSRGAARRGRMRRARSPRT